MNLDIERISVGNIRTLDEFVVDAIGMPFDHEQLKDFNVDLSVAESLESAMREYDGQFKSKVNFHTNSFDQHGNRIGRPIYPERTHRESRVGIFSQSRVINKSRVIEGHTFVGVDVVREAKKHLLFSHRVFVDMPMFIVPRMDTDVASWLSHVKRDLLEYARMTSLIKRRIVIPINVFQLRPVDFENIWLKPHGKFEGDPKSNSLIRQIAHFMCSQAPRFERKGAENFVINALMAQHEVRACSNFYDPFISDEITAFAMKCALLKLSMDMASKDIIVPIVSYGISSNYAIMPDHVSMEDVTTMRENETVFEEWRNMLSEVFGKMSENSGGYNNFSKEFGDLIEDRSRDWQHRSERLFGKGFAASIRDARKDTFQSVTAGLVAGLVVPSQQGLLVAGVPFATKFLVKAFGSIVGYSSNRKARISLENHFLAIGARAAK